MGDFLGNSYPADGPVSQRERSWAMAAHLSTLLGSIIPFGNILAPLVIWLIQKDKSRFVDKHSREALVFQIGLAVAAVLLTVLVIMTFGSAIVIVLPAVIMLFIADILYMILATVRANEGKIWEYPITTRFVA